MVTSEFRTMYRTWCWLLQFCGSGSWSVCFRASWIQIRYSDMRIRILRSPSKNIKKNSYCDFFMTSLKNDINVPLKRNEQNYFLSASWRSMTQRAGSGPESVSQRYGFMYLDPFQIVKDPQHCVVKYLDSYSTIKIVEWVIDSLELFESRRRNILPGVCCWGIFEPWNSGKPASAFFIYVVF